MDHVRVLGVDGCRKGWVGFVVDDRYTACRFAVTVGELVAELGKLDGIGIDIPIGLSEDARRAADVSAKAVIGRRASSVFFTPVRAALAAEAFSAANAESVRRTGQGISQQAYALRTKILEVAGWLPGSPAPVWEVHPEVAFAIANDAPLRHSKRTWAGAEERRRILADHGIAVDGELLPGGGQAGVDDVLDAAVVAWSAGRLVRGEAVSFPDPPVVGVHGRQVAIWA